MDDLSRYHRATVGLWRRSYAELLGEPDDRCLRDAAVHAVLAGLRRHRDRRALLAAYEASPTADFGLIGSLLAGDERSERFWRVREAAFHLRWCEIAGGGA